MSSGLDERRTRSSRIVWVALGLGLLADLLLRETPWGLNATVWLSLLALAGLPVARRRWPLFLAVAVAAGLAWRASPVLLSLFAATYWTSISLPLLRGPLSAGVFPYGFALINTFVDAAFLALGPVWDLVRRRRRIEGPDRAYAPLLRGALVAVPFLLVFGALFSAADPVFEWYVGDIFDFVLERLPSHVLTMAFFGWIACGILYGLAVVLVPRIHGPDSGPPPARRGTEVVVVLVLVDALFLLFLLVQIRTLFGGRELVEATLGLSYAEYAREGFFQLITAASIAIPGLLVADWFVPEGSISRGRIRGLAAALLVMMTAVLVSAALRMHLYVDAYSLTELRFYTSAFMVWLAIVIAWFGWTVLRGRRARFMAGVLGSFMIGVLGVSAVNPDAIIIRANAARITGRVDGSVEERSRPAFDARYATSLSDDAVPALLEVLPRLDRWQKCVVAEDLLARSELEDGPDWRTWNLSRWRAREGVAAAANDLRQAFSSCRVTFSVPDLVTAETTFPVRWRGFMGPTDHISIARSGAPRDEYVSLSATWRRPLEVKAPAVPGRYEIRYHLGRSRRVVGRQSLVVVASTGGPISPDGQALGLRRVADRLDVVPVGIEDEGPVVRRMVLLSNPRRAVVPAPGGQAGFVEGVDDVPISTAEGQVHRFRPRLPVPDPELGPPGVAERHGLGELHDHPVAERPERRLVEPPAGGEVFHSEDHVIDHPADSVLSSQTTSSPTRISPSARTVPNAPPPQRERIAS